MRNELNIICFDMETSGVIPGHNEVLSIGAVAYRADDLEPFPAHSGGEFYSLLKPLHFDRLEREAMAINGLTEKELRAAPDQKVVWQNFLDWTKNFRVGKGKTNLPIAAGKNIRTFDLKFVDELNKLHSPKKSDELLFHQRTQIDLEDFIFHWFSEDDELEDHKMDTLRDYFGLPGEAGGRHNALTDAKETGLLIMSFLKMYRKMRKKRTAKGEPMVNLKGCLSGRPI